jgi:hypothetical protein
MKKQRVVEQLFRDKTTGEILDLEKLEASKKQPPIFENFCQVPPEGAALLAYCELRPQAIAAIFAALSVMEWNNIFSLSPKRLEIIAHVPVNQYSVVVGQLLKAGVFLRVYPGTREPRYWLNPQIAWRGKSKFFWTVCEKFRTVLWGERQLVPGGTQELLRIPTANKLKTRLDQKKAGVSLLPEVQ